MQEYSKCFQTIINKHVVLQANVINIRVLDEHIILYKIGAVFIEHSLLINIDNISPRHNINHV